MKISKELFGLRQQDIALILKISRSLWALYETGRRNLPRESNRLLSDMEVHMLTTKEKDFKQWPETIKEDAEIKKQLKKQIEDNEYSQYSIARKIATLQETFEKSKRAIRTTSFLGAPEQLQKNGALKVVPLLEHFAIKNYKDSKSQLFLLELELEKLQQELIAMKNAMQKLA